MVQAMQRSLFDDLEAENPKKQHASTAAGAKSVCRLPLAFEHNLAKAVFDLGNGKKTAACVNELVETAHIPYYLAALTLLSKTLSFKE